MPPGGLHIRWPDAAARAGSAADELQVVRRARLRAREPPQPQRHRGPERPLRHHRPRQGLQRHPPGAARTSASTTTTCRRLGMRLHKVNVVWPLEATITREFAHGLEEILVVEEKRQVIEYQLKEELYGWRPDVRPNVLGKFDESEGDAAGGEWGQANPSAALAAARPGRPDAGDHRQGDRQAAGQARRRRRRLGADDAARGADRRQGAEPRRQHRHRRQRRRRPERAPCFCSGCPHNTSHQGARGLARRRRHRLPLHGGLDGPLDRDLQPDGRRGRLLGRPGAVHRPTATSSPTSATAPTSTRACWRCARRSPPGSTSPTRSCSTTRSR